MPSQGDTSGQPAASGRGLRRSFGNAALSAAARSLAARIETTGIPRLPGKAYLGPEGRLRVPLLPTGVLYDRLAFFPFKVTAWMRDGIRREDLNDYLATHYRRAGPRHAKTVAVLGAGNVSAIPLTDSFTKLFQEGGVVLLKMNPVNDYLGPIFERVLKPLSDKGYMHIIYGEADVGATAVHHRLVDEVHLTGSRDSHDCIVWGPPGANGTSGNRRTRPCSTSPSPANRATSVLGSFFQVSTRGDN